MGATDPGGQGWGKLWSCHHPHGGIVSWQRGTWRSPSHLPSRPSAPSRMNLLISADSLAFSSTSVSISFMRLPISSEMRAAVSRSTLGAWQPSAPPPRCPRIGNKGHQDKGRTSCLQGPVTKPRLETVTSTQPSPQAAQDDQPIPITPSSCPPAGSSSLNTKTLPDSTSMAMAFGPNLMEEEGYVPLVPPSG